VSPRTFINTGIEMASIKESEEALNKLIADGLAYIYIRKDYSVSLDGNFKAEELRLIANALNNLEKNRCG